MNFQDYPDLIGPGVEMPAITISPKYFKKYECEGADNPRLIRAICEKGLADKGLKTKEYKDRLEYELSMFEELKYLDYILAVWDVCNFADENNISRGIGRGSAAGSLVLYLMGVTGVDPVKYGLFFERFVSKARAKFTEVDGTVYFDGSLLCDVDLDFDYTDRQTVIEYVNQKYKGQTAHILTINTLSGKLCFKEVMKIFWGFSEDDANEISAHIPKEFGNVKPLDVARTESDKFDEFCKLYPEIYTIALKLEDLNKNFAVHASGIAISCRQIDTQIPIQLTSEGKRVTGVEMGWTGEICVKFDILGLRTLSVIKEACRLAGIKPSDIDPLHPSVYAACQVLESPQGIFQIEADTQFGACKRIKPESIQELSDLMALARPGAMDYIPNYIEAKSSGMSADHGHAELNKILDTTKGIPIYQEQMMQLGSRVFGFTLDEAETLRRIVGKKKVKEMPPWKERVYENCKRLGLPTELGDFYWKILEDSANYSFNLSHALSYALLSAQTLYLKFNYPQEFYTALLIMTKHETKPQEEVSKISHELKNFGIKLLPPDLIKSGDDFSVEGANIRFGLSAIKGLNKKAVIPVETFKGKPRTNKFEVFLSANESKVNMGVLCSLIQSGALSSCGENRPRMVLEYQSFKLLTPREQRLALELGPQYGYDLLDLIADMRKSGKLCSDAKPFMKDSRWETFKKNYDKYKEIYVENNKHPSLSKWWFEKQLLGYSYSVPLKSCFADKQYVTLEDLHDHAGSKQKIYVVAYVEDFVVRKSLKGNKYMRIEVSDETGQTSAIMADSPKNQKFTAFLDKGGIVPSKKDVISIKGEVSQDGSLFVEGLEVLDTKIYMKISELK